ncbi:gamma-tubulin complex component 5 [Rhipicephalus sanguineus]|uniref:gamma-tubulin complex component 5 n=1 Tax=Rhipicephalus sanguineus TaxID=34632 RepID=UPI001893A85A|nr:gamma-tubulin complex component 5 [Rhipicephalus sanguineus]
MTLEGNVLNPYWNWCHNHPVEAPAHTTISSNLVKEWEKYLNSCGVLTPPGEHRILSERLLLRETLWMLRGTKELFAFSWNGTEFVVNDNFKLTHLTQAAVKNSLEEVCRYASYVAHLQDFISATAGVGEETSVVSLTYQAFANSVAEQLVPYNRLLVDIEKVLIEQKETFTLMMLFRDMHPYFESVRHLHDIYSSVLPSDSTTSPVQSTVKLLSVLERALESATILNQHRSQTVSLYLDTLKPFIDFVDELSSTGKLTDPYQEFPIRRARDVTFEDPTYWKSSLYICDSDYLNTIMGPHLLPLTSAGKSMEHLMHATQSKNPVQRSMPGTLYTSIINNIPHSASKVESEANQAATLRNVAEIFEEINQWTKQIGFFGLINVASEHMSIKMDSVTRNLTCTLYQVQQAITTAVTERCRQNSAKFLHYLQSECELSKQIDTVHSHFLMFAGEIMHLFTSEVFLKLLSDTPETWQNLSFLNFALQEALSCHCQPVPFCKKLSMRLKGSFAKVPLDGFDNVVLRYDVAWPMSIVLTETTLDLYNRIFVFLCKVKCAKFALEELHFQELHKSYVKETMTMKRVARFLQLLRFQVLTFLNSFHACLMQEVLHSSKLAFDKELESATDLDTVIKCHEGFVAKVFRQCLLSDQFSQLREPLLSFLKLCTKLHVLWNRGMENIPWSEVKSIHDGFIRHHAAFKSTAIAYVRRGYEDSSQLLTFGLDTPYLYVLTTKDS